MDLKILQLSQDILRICNLTGLYLIMKVNDFCNFTGISRYINSTNNFWTRSKKQQTNKQTNIQTNKQANKPQNSIYKLEANRLY